MENEKLCEIEKLLIKEISWYLNDDISLKEKQDKLQISLGANRMINNVILIETLNQRAKALENAETDIQRKIKRFGNGKV